MSRCLICLAQCGSYQKPLGGCSVTSVQLTPLQPSWYRNLNRTNRQKKEPFSVCIWVIIPVHGFSDKWTLKPHPPVDTSGIAFRFVQVKCISPLKKSSGSEGNANCSGYTFRASQLNPGTLIFSSTQSCKYVYFLILTVERDINTYLLHSYFGQHVFLQVKMELCCSDKRSSLHFFCCCGQAEDGSLQNMQPEMLNSINKAHIYSRSPA